MKYPAAIITITMMSGAKREITIAATIIRTIMIAISNTVKRLVIIFNLM
jgi:hypothetical protein